MEKLDLSIIVPVYNTEKYIDKCLRSIIEAVKDTELKIEIIVINDGSPDNSELIIKEYLEKFPSLIKYHKKENAGLADTKNFGINVSKGIYLSFIDSDDYIDSNFYKECEELIKEQKTDIIIYDWETIDLRNNCSYIVEAMNNKYEDEKWGCIDVSIMPSSCNKIVKKSLFEGLEFPLGLRYEDLGTTLILFFKSKYIKYINKPYYKYCLTPSSIMRVEFDNKNFQMIDIFNILCKRLNSLNISQKEKEKAIYMTCTRRFYEELLEKLMLYSNKKELIEEFCEKIFDFENILYNNYYFKKLIKSQNAIRRLGANLIHKAIKKKNTKLLSIYLTKRLYYRYFAIRYKNLNELEED